MSYILGKLSEINYRITIHKGSANERLASEAKKILLLFPSEVPAKFQKQFQELRELIELTLKNLPAPGLTPIKIRSINNSKASEYIKLLYLIEQELNE